MKTYRVTTVVKVVNPMRLRAFASGFLGAGPREEEAAVTGCVAGAGVGMADAYGCEAVSVGGEATGATELCLVCCPESEIPEKSRDFVRELRAEHPATVLAGKTSVAGLAACWNCRGRREVQGP